MPAGSVLNHLEVSILDRSVEGNRDIYLSFSGFQMLRLTDLLEKRQEISDFAPATSPNSEYLSFPALFVMR